MEQLTEWLKKEKKFFRETFNRLSIITKPEIRVYEGKDMHIQGARAIFVPTKYMDKCRDYVQKKCNIITYKKKE